MRTLVKRTTLLTALLAFAAAAFYAGPAAAAEDPHPAWTLQMATTVTNLPPETAANELSGPAYEIFATNVGGAPTIGTYTITTELPQGTSVAAVKNPYIRWGKVYGGGGEAPCQVSGQVVTCTTSGPTPVGMNAAVYIFTDVGAAEGEELEATTTVEGGGAGSVTKTLRSKVSATPAPFGITASSSGLFGGAFNIDGTVATKAGSHPGAYESISLDANRLRTLIGGGQPEIPGNGLRDVRVDLPRGMIVNPQAAEKCTEAQLEFAGEGGPACPAGSVVGLISVMNSGGATFALGPFPLYNMVPPAGAPAEFGFSFFGGIYTHIEGIVRTGGDYGLSAATNDILNFIPVSGFKVELWGDPSSGRYDEVRGKRCIEFEGTCPGGEPQTMPFVSMPSNCGGPITTRAAISSWEEPEVFSRGSFESADANGNPVGVEGCNQLEFNPSIESKATTTLADSPTGLDFKLKVPQAEGVEAPSVANVKDVRVSLPEGMVVNPSSADGLSGCSSAQIEINGPEPARCPDASKIGTAEVTTPLLEAPLSGQVYLATPFDNQFHSLLATYITVNDPRTGVVLKIPGEVQSDPANGHLTAVFRENPELPFSELKVSFFNGARAPLTSPATCGTKTTNAVITPWSTPEGADVPSSDSFTTTTAPGGGDCPSSVEGLPNQLSFNAGTLAPQAGSYSPFVLAISRPDGSQRMTGIETALPKGLSGKLAGIPYCPESAIAAATARSHSGGGALEQASPSCPAASEVGSVNVGAGSGPNPLHVGGHVYLAGPYKGAPLSFAVITPAIAGPFDLGTVVTRVALKVDPETAKITAVSDPLPTQLQGIPLDIRQVALNADRKGFTLNPTSCDAMKVSGQITSASGQGFGVESPFQVGSCSALAFKPKLALSLKGGTSRAQHPALKAVLTQPQGQANIGAVSVTLPRTAFLDQSHIKTICTRVQFNSGAIPGAGCPAGSIYGKATAYSPLLDAPLSGPVFLRSSSHQLPDLVVALHGQVDVVLAGTVDSVKGRLRNRFEAAPDAPVSKFVLEMQGGKKGLVVNSANLCKTDNRAALKMRAQNGKELESSPLVTNSCKSKAKKKHAKHKSPKGKH
jgi:hypothetical protein